MGSPSSSTTRVSTSAIASSTRTRHPQFPFGWGLSYSDFTLSNVSTTQHPDGGLDVSFDVSNTGQVAGATVPQVYVGPAPQVPSGVQQADRSLSGYDASNSTLTRHCDEPSTWPVRPSTVKRSPGVRVLG